MACNQRAGRVKGLVRMSATWKLVPTLRRSNCLHSNCCFNHLKLMFCVLFMCLMDADEPVDMTVIVAWLSSMNLT